VQVAETRPDVHVLKQEEVSVLARVAERAQRREGKSEVGEVARDEGDLDAALPRSVPTQQLRQGREHLADAAADERGAGPAEQRARCGIGEHDVSAAGEHEEAHREGGDRGRGPREVVGWLRSVFVRQGRFTR